MMLWIKTNIFQEIQSTVKPSKTYDQGQKSGRMASSLGGLLGGKANDFGWTLERGSDFLK